MDDQNRGHVDIESGESSQVTGPRPKRDNHTFQRGTSSEILPKRDWIERKKNTLMIVASLIATMSFQAGLNPPSGVWQDNSKDTGIASPSPFPQHKAGHSVLADNYKPLYIRFLVSNTVAFIASFSIVLLLISGLPLRTKGLMWILMFIMWIAIVATAFTYHTFIAAYSPRESLYQYFLGCSLLAWMVLLSLLFIIHTIRLIVKAVRKLIRVIVKAVRKLIRLIVKAVRKLRQSAAKWSMNDSS
ncbi:uncharacterized protein LOC132609610 [Lycium barbarum]|uniref:uncharacterized protein LOC132609610 n=1 Tax=Lycium barbarum TaxID=112863 RepID=UPI00293ECCBA|nr:uncharacterized protein LOC132609610 [Lycium barbarum]